MIFENQNFFMNFQYFSVWFFLNQLYTFWNARKSCFWWNSGRVDPLYRPIELKIFFGVTQNEFKLVPSCNRERLWVYATQRRWDRLGRVLGHHEACRKSLEHSRMTEPLRRAATVSLCHSMPTVAVAQSSWIVLVPSCMLHGDREPVPSDPVDIELQNLNSCTELPEEMTSIFIKGPAQTTR